MTACRKKKKRSPVSSRIDSFRIEFGPQRSKVVKLLMVSKGADESALQPTQD